MAATAVAENTKPTHAPGSGAIQLPASMPSETPYHRRCWWWKAPPEATREDAMHPSFWNKVGKHLNRHDVITLLADDESWELEICVEAVRQNGVDVTIRKNFARTPINRAGTRITDDYATEYRPGEGWGVVRTKDRHRTISGHTLEVSAINQWHRDQPRAA